MKDHDFSPSFNNSIESVCISITDEKEYAIDLVLTDQQSVEREILSDERKKERKTIYLGQTLQVGK
jgi:hypothetical protein